MILMRSTALSDAAYRGHLPLVKLLKERGAGMTAVSQVQMCVLCMCVCVLCMCVCVCVCVYVCVSVCMCVLCMCVCLCVCVCVCVCALYVCVSVCACIFHMCVFESLTGLKMCSMPNCQLIVHVHVHVQ